MLTVAVTGHRPEKIDDPQWVKDRLGEAFERTFASVVIQGMASGVDLWSARVAKEIGIPFVCAKPWKGHKPRVADRNDYEQALKHAYQIVNVTEYDDYPGPWVYQTRNEWMVDRAGLVVAVWDGSSGGTANCVKYAESIGTPLYRIDPKEKKVYEVGRSVQV